MTGRRLYDEAVREAVIVDWETADRICGNRWKTLSNLMESMENHRRLKLHHDVRDRLFSASASTLVRLLKPVRATAGTRRRRGRRHSVGREVPVPIYDEWDRPPSGFLEIDLVAHCGGPLVGSFIHSLVATDAAPTGPRPLPFCPVNNP